MNNGKGRDGAVWKQTPYPAIQYYNTFLFFKLITTSIKFEPLGCG